MPTEKHHRGDNTNQDGTCLLETGSGPIRKYLFRVRNLFRRTCEIECVFSSFAGDMDLNGSQAAVFHSQAELFIDFLDAVLLEAFAHDGVSVRDIDKATLIASYF